MLSETLVSTPPALLDTPSVTATRFPEEKPQSQHNLVTPQLSSPTRASISPISHRSQDWLSSDGALSRNEAQSCRCMQKGVILLEEVENQTHNFDPVAIDSSLAYHKGALDTCTSMLRCQNCAVCIEIAMLLTLVASKLSQLCEKIVSQLSQQSQRFQKSHTQQPAQSWSSEPEERSGVDVPRRNLFLGITR